MRDLDHFFTTRITVDVEVATQFGPETAFQLLQVQLHIPAIKAYSFVKAETNYRKDEFTRGPSRSFEPIPVPGRTPKPPAKQGLRSRVREASKAILGADVFNAMHPHCGTVECMKSAADKAFRLRLQGDDVETVRLGLNTLTDTGVLTDDEDTSAIKLRNGE